MALKILRTLRLDGSDEVVFERAAPAGEIAVPGSWQFWGDDPAALAGKRRQAFNGGFLGIGSFGFSTLTAVASITAEDRAAAVERLADHLRAAWGAPDRATALAAAEDEIAFSESLATHPVGTVVAMSRRVVDGAIREQFRTLERAGPPPEDFSKALFRAITAVPDEEPDESLDLSSLARRRP